MKLFILGAMVFVNAVFAMDQLPSWNEGPAKKAILEFVSKVTNEKGPDYVQPADRIATFDNDGTLWTEVPTVEAEFTKVQLAKLLKKNPELKKKEPYKTILSKSKTHIADLSKEQIMEIMARTHSGMTEEEFASEVKEFFNTARHPKLDVPYTRTTYKPMQELLDYLRGHQFKIFISSGGDTSFMRVVATQIYGIPSENIIGTSFEDKLVQKDGKIEVMRTGKFDLLNDRENKPVGIYQHIGKRPIMSVGNVRNGGDVEHLQFSSENEKLNLQLLINHDDAAREAAYSEKDGKSLKAAATYGFEVVSIKKDWKEIYQ